MLHTANAEAVRTVVVVIRVHVTTVEVQIIRVDAVHRSRPIVAVATHIVEGTIAVVPVP